jgi:hypothetical protein
MKYFSTHHFNWPTVWTWLRTFSFIIDTWSSCFFICMILWYFHKISHHFVNLYILCTKCGPCKSSFRFYTLESYQNIHIHDGNKSIATSIKHRWYNIVQIGLCCYLCQCSLYIVVKIVITYFALFTDPTIQNRSFLKVFFCLEICTSYPCCWVLILTNRQCNVCTHFSLLVM